MLDVLIDFLIHLDGIGVGIITHGVGQALEMITELDLNVNGDVVAVDGLISRDRGQSAHCRVIYGRENLMRIRNTKEVHGEVGGSHICIAVIVRRDGDEAFRIPKDRITVVVIADEVGAGINVLELEDDGTRQGDGMHQFVVCIDIDLGGILHVSDALVSRLIQFIIDTISADTGDDHSREGFVI